MTNADRVREFHETFGVPVGVQPVARIDSHYMRVGLLQEEFDEYKAAVEADDVVEVADAIADMLYVLYGTAIEHGIPIDAVFAEVHRSNMTKADENGTPYRRDDGKIIKGPRFEPPMIARLLNPEESMHSKRDAR